MSTRAGSRFRTQNVEWQAHLQGAPLASFRSRALAFAIDGAIVVLLVLVFGALPGLLGQRPGGPVTISVEFGSLAGVVVTLLYFGLATYFGSGATPGKRLMGIRVVSIVHPRLSLWHSIERALGYAASSLEAGFGFFQYFTHPNRQTVHDRIAETIVIVSPKTPAKAKPASAHVTKR
jgi:uncharacterized RDD family membrane protein YckC